MMKTSTFAMVLGLMLFLGALTSHSAKADTWSGYEMHHKKDGGWTNSVWAGQDDGSAVIFSGGDIGFHIPRRFYGKLVRIAFNVQVLEAAPNAKVTVTIDEYPRGSIADSVTLRKGFNGVAYLNVVLPKNTKGELKGVIRVNPRGKAKVRLQNGVISFTVPK